MPMRGSVRPELYQTRTPAAVSLTPVMISHRTTPKLNKSTEDVQRDPMITSGAILRFFLFFFCFFGVGGWVGGKGGGGWGGGGWVVVVGGWGGGGWGGGGVGGGGKGHACEWCGKGVWRRGLPGMHASHPPLAFNAQLQAMLLNRPACPLPRVSMPEMRLAPPTPPCSSPTQHGANAPDGTASPTARPHTSHQEKVPTAFVSMPLMCVFCCSRARPTSCMIEKAGPIVGRVVASQQEQQQCMACQQQRNLLGQWQPAHVRSMHDSAPCRQRPAAAGAHASVRHAPPPPLHAQPAWRCRCPSGARLRI